jgi:RNA polymerase sigma-70 factor (ECF subfamily)
MGEGELGPSMDASLDLVKRIQDGDSRAWDELYLRYRDQLILSIRCRLGPGLRSHLESEDILQSVFRDALSDLHRFEPRRPRALNHYLHTCVLNKIRTKADYFGAAKRSGETALTDGLSQQLPDPAEGTPQYHDSQRYEALEGALARLSEEMREVVLLRRVEGLSNQETADVLGKTPAAASKLYNRAVARLAMLMQRRE